MQKSRTVDPKILSQNDVDAEYESCVLCGKQTDIRRDTHIDFRVCYVEGAGQLCPGCWAHIYGVTKECKQK